MSTLMKSLLITLMLATASTALADDAPDAQRDARLHYERGMTHYQLGEFGPAVEEFKAAYALAHQPGLLFNLAQASRLGKQYEQALYFYRSYLRVAPEAANRDDVERHIVELEPLAEAEEKRKLEHERAAHAPPPPTTAPPGTAASTATLAQRPPGPSARTLRLSGIVVGAVGLAALGAGAGLGAAALDAQNQLSALKDSATARWSSASDDLYARGQHEAAAATAMYVVGGVALATGVVLYTVGRLRERSRYARASAGDGASFARAWTF
jgi:tetratricopeptide (TPR) repeat protein